MSLNNNIEVIGNYVFYGCFGFTGSLTIPDKIGSLGIGAFSGCSGCCTISSIKLPKKLKRINDNLFENCSEISVTENIFSNCENLISIGNKAFYGCEKMIFSLLLPDTINLIGEKAFYGCKNLNGMLHIPKTISLIGSYAFAGCSGLTGSMKIPETMNIINEGLFNNCSGLNLKIQILKELNIMELLHLNVN